MVTLLLVVVQADQMACWDLDIHNDSRISVRLLLQGPLFYTLHAPSCFDLMLAMLHMLLRKQLEEHFLTRFK